jgi:hypothetical protein
MSQGAGRSLLAVMTTTSKGYEDYVVFVESKALRARSKQEPSRGDASEIDCAKRSPKGAAAGRRGCQYPWQTGKLGAHCPRRKFVWSPSGRSQGKGDGRLRLNRENRQISMTRNRLVQGGLPVGSIQDLRRHTQAWVGFIRSLILAGHGANGRNLDAQAPTVL